MTISVSQDATSATKALGMWLRSANNEMTHEVIVPRMDIKGENVLVGRNLPKAQHAEGMERIPTTK
jgi:hypothetical protein